MSTKKKTERSFRRKRAQNAKLEKNGKGKFPYPPTYDGEHGYDHFMAFQKKLEELGEMIDDGHDEPSELGKKIKKTKSPKSYVLTNKIDPDGNIVDLESERVAQKPPLANDEFAEREAVFSIEVPEWVSQIMIWLMVAGLPVALVCWNSVACYGGLAGGVIGLIVVCVCCLG